MPEQRIVLQHCGVIDPSDIDAYLRQDGFNALSKARREMTPEQVVAEVKASGLRGRGGAGFPTGLKWELASKARGDVKYVICNADEGEVGTFKDRYILERDPFSLVEAIAIAGYAIGASKGYIYLRAEYHRLLGLLEHAIAQAQERGFLDGFAIEIHEGAGSYVCGEESALMDSIEGKRGESRFRPPFPPTQGLWGQPTIINNVETLVNAPRIIRNGAQWFSEIGTEQSKGTKVFSVSGDVARPGVYELVMGSSLRELVEELAQAHNTKLVLVGGASGRALPAEQLDTPLAFETVLGAGAIIVCNETRDAVDVAFQAMEFFADECCGKCVPCREGTEAMLNILDRFRKGCGSELELKLLEDISRVMQLTSLCGLGQAAPNPVLDTLQYFPDSYQAKMAKAGAR